MDSRLDCSEEAVLNILNGSCTQNTRAEAIFIAPDVLQVQGILHDAIDEVRQLLSFDDAQVLATIKELWLSGSQPYPSGASQVDACAWTLWLDNLTEKWLMSDSCSLADVRHHLQQLKDTGVCSSDALPTAGNISSYNISRTRKGYFGMSPAGVAPGDNVSVLLGCDSAAILRHQPNEKHLFIGCAYIHGIMDGEVLLGPIPEDFMVVVDDEGGDVLVENFLCRKTGEFTKQNPRLQPLTDDWQRVCAPSPVWPAKTFNAFQNKITGQISYADPRLNLEAPRVRGVPFQPIDLV